MNRTMGALLSELLPRKMKVVPQKSYKYFTSKTLVCVFPLSPSRSSHYHFLYPPVCPMPLNPDHDSKYTVEPKAVSKQSLSTVDSAGPGAEEVMLQCQSEDREEAALCGDVCFHCPGLWRASKHLV